MYSECQKKIIKKGIKELPAKNQAVVKDNLQKDLESR
jgi:hypothetical protein